ncbi:Oxidoreductase ptaL [Paramyrothecium foliicola]|nr:Oxidoreductase ptaL [Paramyrothecium foliicola]
MGKTIVILGAGWAGLPLAHKLLKYTVPKVPSLKVILVSPSTHFFWNVAATRGVVPGEIADEKLFIPIQPAFERCSPDNFEFVLGNARHIRHDESAVDVALIHGGKRGIDYDHLVIATGSRIAIDVPLKLTGSYESTLAEFHRLQKQIKDAKSIVISGAGPTGIEVAGELAAKYGSTKEITLLASTELLPSDRPSILPSLRKVVEKDLGKLGVKVIKSARVSQFHRGTDGSGTNITMDNGSKLLVDLFLPLHGCPLNTSFIPAEWLDAGGSIILDDYLRVASTNNIWAIGDVGNKETKQLTVTDNQIIYLSTTLDVAIRGEEPSNHYQPEAKTMIFLSLGKNHGTGQIGNWRLWGFMVNFVKGRNLFVDTAQGYVNGEHLRHASM